MAKGDRTDAPNVAFVITDGNANVAIATTAANAAAVRQQYTYVITLSVGRDPNVYGLWTLASAPTNQTVYMVNSYRDLAGLLNTRFLNSFVGRLFMNVSIYTVTVGVYLPWANWVMALLLTAKNLAFGQKCNLTILEKLSQFYTTIFEVLLCANVQENHYSCCYQMSDQMSDFTTKMQLMHPTRFQLELRLRAYSAPQLEPLSWI